MLKFFSDGVAVLIQAVAGLIAVDDPLAFKIQRELVHIYRAPARPISVVRMLHKIPVFQIVFDLLGNGVFVTEFAENHARYAAGPQAGEQFVRGLKRRGSVAALPRPLAPD